MPLMDKTEKRLTSVSSFLTLTERLQLVNSVPSSLPTYAMCSFEDHVWFEDRWMVASWCDE
jgi:hypothetical protein